MDSSESEPGYKAFIADHGINHKVLKMTPNKEAKAGKEKKRTSTDSICEAILFVMDRSNQPIHIHCNQGKHRTGCVIACLRKIEGMSVDDALVEYATYAGSKQRLGDIELIKAFDGEVLFKYAMKTGAAARFDAMLHDSHLTLCWNLDRLIDALGMGTRYLKQRAATSKRLHSRYVASVPELSMSVSSMSVGSPSTPSTPSSPMSDDGSQMVPVSARRFSFDLAAATEPALGKRCASVPPRLHLDDVDFVIPVSELRS